MKQEPERAQKLSPDLAAQRLEALKAAFPEAVKDGALDCAALRAAIGDIPENAKGDEFFGLSWAGRAEAERAVIEPSRMTLIPKPEESVRWDEAKNLIIEGDNLEVLKLLLARYAGQVKVIYIDPPYNTGKDFVYRDDFRKSKSAYLAQTGQRGEGGASSSTNPETSGRYHSDWLSMMYPRLKIARELLRDDGVIFVSIDDNEMHHLRSVLDEIFGEENFQACISRATGTPTGGGNKAIVNEIDYILVFAKSKVGVIEGLPFSSEDESIYDREDERGRYLIRSLRRTGGEDRREDRPSMFFPVQAPDGSLVVPIAPAGYESRWICGKKKFEDMSAAGMIEWINRGDEDAPKWQVYQKFYLEGRTKQPSNFWREEEGNKKATRDLKEIFDNQKFFDFPKPVGLIRKILTLATDEDSLVVDFFAGSATTAQAVLEQNAEDNGNRSFLLVQLPEPIDPESEAGKAGYETVADIAKERVRRVIAGYGENPKPLDAGFRVFTLAASSFPENTFEPDPDATEEENAQNFREHLGRAAQGKLLEEGKIVAVAYEIATKEGLSPLSRVSEVIVGGQKMLRVEDLELGRAVLVWLASEISDSEARAVAKDVSPEGDRVSTTLVVPDSALGDSAKANLVANLRLRVL